jgi:WhiB family transcriptional regulator, redox-sensing transcriptional regulator
VAWGKTTVWLDLLDDLAWLKDAQCRREGADPKLFISKDDDEPEPPYPSKEALRYCNVCPVRNECLDAALRNDADGIWGGLSDHQRRQIKRRYERNVCPGCTSTLIVKHGQHHEICLACSLSWPIV